MNDTVKRMKRQIIDMEKIFVYHVSEKGLYPELSKFDTRKQSNPIKIVKKCEQIFLPEKIMASKSFGKCKLKQK